MTPQNFLLEGTEHDKQIEEYYCGAASINMILSYWDKQQPQEEMWTAIKDNTGTQPRPTNAEQMDGWFWNQQCDACPSGGYNCWFSTPEAMAATLNAYAPAIFTVEYHPQRDVACGRLADTLSAPSKSPAAFTIAPGLHWCVAVGYQLDGPSTPYPWNGQNLTALFVRDPQTEDPGTDILHLVTTDGLQRPVDGLLMGIICPPHQFEYPIVVQVKSPQNPWLRILATAWLRIDTVIDWIARAWIPKTKPPRTPPEPL